jgi:putative Mn2+ efflux pump MntP
MNTFPLLLILIGVSSDALLTGCLLGAFHADNHELKKLLLVILLLLLETSFFYGGFKSGNLLMAHIKGGAGLMAAMVLLSLGVKMLTEWTFKLPEPSSTNSYNVVLLMIGTAVYVFAAGTAFGLLQISNCNSLLVLPAFLLLFLSTGRALASHTGYLNILHRSCSFMVITGGAILIIQYI